MNERIKELIAQCSFTVTEYSMGIDNSYEDFDKELFAELIVRECANYLGDQGEFNSAENIKALFGVK